MLSLALSCAACGEASEPLEPASLRSPCEAIAFTCADPSLDVFTVDAAHPAPGGLNALGSPGDLVLANGRVRAVIDALAHPHYLAPSGGNLLDLASASGDDDSVAQVFHTVGLLPGDSVLYEHLRVVREPDRAAVEVFGRLAGDAEVSVATRYEIRPCEPGLRVRTEVTNGSAEPKVWALVDGWYWSGRSALPFAPTLGQGFVQPPISLASAEFHEYPFMAAASHADPAAAYFAVDCERASLTGFHTEYLSALGSGPRIAQPRHVEVFERFIGVSPGRALAPSIDLASELRRQLHGEPYVTLRGRVRTPDDERLGDEVRASVVVYEGVEDAGPDDRTPWTQAIPDVDGRFAVRVRAHRELQIELRGFGRVERTWHARTAAEDLDVGDIELAAGAELTVSVTVDGAADHARVFVRAADTETREAVVARLFDAGSECAPLLGSPTGGSPACARMLVDDPVTVRLPPGAYQVYASAGLFASGARENVELGPSESAVVELAVQRLPVLPEGVLSADFHVHGAASFDSTVPDVDRVASFLAANVDVVAATDHDVVWDYAEARALLGADARLRVIPGVETTAHIPFDFVPGRELPTVIGHWNAWPIPFTPEGPYNGAPWDELVEPGALFGRLVDEGFSADDGVLQLNHPFAAPQAGRDFGFPRAVGVDATSPLPTEFDGTASSLILRTPPGARFANSDYHAQEVMNGTSNRNYQPFRAYWFFLLNQGILRAGTANSDSHTLVDSLLGTPRTLVWTDQTVARFDLVAFNRAVRSGAMVGTNGPVIEAALTDTSGASRAPSLTPFIPAAGAELTIRVTAAPWVPVDEVRVIVNGRVARTLQAELRHPASALGTDGLERLETSIALTELLEDVDRDAWIVVEAGRALATNGDLDCDGIPDTGDNDGDGVVDWRDVDRNGDRVVDELDLLEVSDPPAPCDRDQRLGPLARPLAPADAASDAIYGVLSPGGYPAAFTNPFVLDHRGDGFDPPGL